MSKKVELIAPAGDLRKLKYALAYGADAVYCGLPAFSLRAQTGFDLKSLKEGIKYAHKLKKKVYVTINIFVHNRHLKILPKHLKELKKIKPDAIVVSDPGILEMIKKFLPKIPIHLSTQMNTLNYEAVKFWQKRGVKRIILGREVGLKDIKEIHQRAPQMELEVFVHGAMCMSYSGRCYLSAWLNSRSANEGLCTQPCRWEYKIFLEEPLRPGEMIPIEADKKGTYIMNSKDLCLIDYLDDLAKAGVVAFKLEGRTKSVYYLAVVTRAYRKAIDLFFDKKNKNKLLAKLKEELYKIDNRGYTTGFLLGDENMARHNFKTSKAVSDWEFVGEVVEIKKQKVFIRVHNVLKAGDAVELVTPDNCYKIKLRELFNKKGEKVTEAHGGTEEVFNFELGGDYDIPVMSVLRSNK
ncbi:MAG: U32 family peptidase C-terminal domain-containing protein [Patescibacteria group bacterium]